MRIIKIKNNILNDILTLAATKDKIIIANYLRSIGIDNSNVSKFYETRLKQDGHINLINMSLGRRIATITDKGRLFINSGGYKKVTTTKSSGSTKENQILECYHCGNKTAHDLLYEADAKATFYDPENTKESVDLPSFYYLTKCRTCGGVLLFNDIHYDDKPASIKTAALCYPFKETLGIGIPTDIMETFDEALNVEKRSSTAFAILIRRCLDLLCKDKKAEGRDLYSQIKYLADKNIIPETFVEISHTLRSLGNMGAHSNYKVDLFEMEEMKTFAVALFEYVYVLPARVKALNDSIAKKDKNK